jgi:nucleotide-binding universal stress UspA family protein
MRVGVVPAAMYDEILVPTDGSEAATGATGHAIDLAATHGARVHALYVVDTSAYSTLEIGADGVIEALRREGEGAVERVADAAEAVGVDVAEHVVTGTPASTIREVAEDVDADLIVMATHGRRGVERYLLGSVTERVVRTADVPVLTIRNGRDEGAGGEAATTGADAADDA